MIRPEAKLRELGEQSALLQHRISLFRTHYESAREEAERLQSDDRQLEKNFRKDLQVRQTSRQDLLCRVLCGRKQNEMLFFRWAGGDKSR